MAHFAEINENNEVIYVVYMDNEIIIDENGVENEQLGVNHLHYHHGSNRRWVKTSYTKKFRGKYASIGDIYREDLDMFISPKPYSSWILNESTGQWEAPIPMPINVSDDSFYQWNEKNKNWELIKKIEN